ncbi:HEAT repeat domain-containing protein [Allorhodopirellula solitaria]|nr:HEAT repeat domain-containing protein [Allorhodopirellula solitaria]
MPTKQTFLLLLALVWLVPANARGADEIPTETEMIATLTSADAPPADKAITCKQLAVFGSADCIPSVAALLSDPELNSWARITLEAIEDPAAEAALIEAATTLEGLPLVGVINSLGVKRAEAAVDLLSENLGSDDDLVAQASAMSLGKVGGPEATAALDEGLKESRMNIRSAAAEGLIRCAEQVPSDQAIELYDLVLDTELPLPRKVEATRGAILARGKAGIDLLVESLKSDNQRIRYIALTTARELSGDGVPEGLLAARSDVPSSQAALFLVALGDRGDASMLPAMLETIEQPVQSDTDVDIKTAAIGVVQRIGDPSCLDALIAAATDDNDVIAAAGRTALQNVGDDEMNTVIIERAREAEGDALETWLQVIGARRIDAIELLVDAAERDDTGIQTAALTALGDVATLDELPILSKRAFSNSEDQDSGVHATALKAVRAACVRMADKAACVDQLEAAMKDADPASQIEILEILAAMGGPEALLAIEKSALGNSYALQNAATRLLGGWMTVDAANVLEKVAAKRDHPYRIRAARGYLRLLRQFPMPPARRDSMAETAMSLSTRDEEKRLLLDAAGRYPSLKMLELTVQIGENSSLQNEAQAVGMAIARDLEPSDRVTDLLNDLDIQEVKVEIVRARYGAPGEEVDVTERLQKQVGNLPIIRLANPNYNSNFGGDPAPGKPKRLTIEYRIDGKKGSSVFEENAPVVLEIP